MSRKKGIYYIYSNQCRKLYKDKGYTLETLTEALEQKSVDTVKHWFAKKNQKPIPWAKAEKLAKVLDANVYNIVGYDGKSCLSGDFADQLEVAKDFTTWNRNTIKTLLLREEQKLPFPDDGSELDWNDVYCDLLLEQLLAAHAHNMKLLEIGGKQALMQYLKQH